MSDHHHHSCHSYQTQQGLLVVFLLNLTFTIIEFTGGAYVNSIAILSDAIHDLGDTFAIGSAWAISKIAVKQRDEQFSYGYGRMTLFSSLISAGVIISGSAVVIFNAIPRLIEPQAIQTEGMILLAILGILFNSVAFFKMKFGHSINERLVMWHLLEDALGWGVTLIGSIVIHFWGILWLDSILAILLALFILRHVILHLKHALALLMQGVPENVNCQELEESLMDIKQVSQIHDMHLWSLDGSYHILSLHVVMEQRLSFEEQIMLKQNIRQCAKSFQIQHATIELETAQEQCELESC